MGYLRRLLSPISSISLLHYSDLIFRVPAALGIRNLQQATNVEIYAKNELDFQGSFFTYISNKVFTAIVCVY